MRIALLLCFLLSGCAIPLDEECDEHGKQWVLVPNIYGDMSMAYIPCRAQ